ncbi:hypothetical protein Zmor_001411 [Zophobas morio]|uniref:Uncharacterized protein n=1 Tax=Zophobas morio TaxID=2755281 RepID=A0AA38MST7_9CUCU|nr:hypothetical protein Zmor_001411 [Zophobas morio]
MEAVNGVSEGDKGGPPPPSPLTGCYLLIVIGEPHCNEHKDIILQRVAKGERPLLLPGLCRMSQDNFSPGTFLAIFDIYAFFTGALPQTGLKM